MQCCLTASAIMLHNNTPEKAALTGPLGLPSGRGEVDEVPKKVVSDCGFRGVRL
jgi:hypothetical protein